MERPRSAVVLLEELMLNNTLVRDLAPLVGLAGLMGIMLNNTEVRDLSPGPKKADGRLG